MDTATFREKLAWFLDKWSGLSDAAARTSIDDLLASLYDGQPKKLGASERSMLMSFRDGIDRRYILSPETLMHATTLHKPSVMDAWFRSSSDYDPASYYFRRYARQVVMSGSVSAAERECAKAMFRDIKRPSFVDIAFNLELDNDQRRSISDVLSPFAQERVALGGGLVMSNRITVDAIVQQLQHRVDSLEAIVRELRK